VEAPITMKFEFVRLFSREEFWLAASAVAAGLVVAWILRGAPPGQAGKGEDDADAPRSGYRDRMIAAVVVGMLLISGGAYLAVSRGLLWSLPVFGLGFGLVLFLIARNRRYRHSSPSLRRTLDFSSAFLNASLLAGILIVVNVIAFRYGGQPLDLTRERTYSLSSQTLNQLETLDRPVTFTMYFGQGVRAARQRDRMVQLLETYKAANPRMIELETLDPYNDVTRIDELVKRVPELELIQGGGVAIEYGKGEGASHAVVRNQDLFLQIPLDPARGRLDHFASTFNGEDEITSAIMRLKEGKKTKVGFTIGHGEPPTSDLNPRGRGIGYWKARFNKVGCEVVDLNLIKENIPQDLALLIVVGPKSPFKPDELLKLRSFSDSGKPLLLLLGNTEPSGLDDLLKSFNLSIGPGLVIDPKYNFNRNPSMVFAPTNPAIKHPIADALGPDRGVLLPGAAPIHLANTKGPGAPAEPPVDTSLVPIAILRTTNLSWAESEPKAIPISLDKQDERGPLAVGIAIADRSPRDAPGSPPQGRPRLVLFSCPAMAENVFQEIERTNLDILMNSAGWLRGRADTLGIAPKPHIALTLSVDPYLRSRLILVPSVVAVLLIIAMGTVVFISRRE
jgi:hypothetical protein